jgi:3-phosphoshikimate 1-carboxyvinyltransferase
MVRSIQSSPLEGSIRIPGSKSHTIRAILLAAMADGKSVINHPLFSRDTEACLDAVALLGADIDKSKEEQIIIKGIGGVPGIPKNVIDVGNSGTTLYLLSGFAATGGHWTIFTGDSQIRRRPVDSLLKALEDLGAEVIITGQDNYPPFLLRGPLSGGKTVIECPTSQYLSSLLLAAPLSTGEVTIDVPLLYERPYIDMTLAWLDRQNIVYRREGYSRFYVQGGQHYKNFTADIPADFSSATFFLCAAAITGSDLELSGLDRNDTQGDKQVVRLLEEMGCMIEWKQDGLIIRGRPLKGIEIDMNAIPDALPAMAAAACYASGETVLRNVPQARLKETDRIAVMSGELKKLGADVQELDDGLIIRESSLSGTRVDGHSDHRVVMALATAALGAEGITEITGAEAAEVTFPEFFPLLDSIQKRAG